MTPLGLLRNRRSLMLIAVDFVLLGMLAGWLVVAPRARVPAAEPVDLAALDEHLNVKAMDDANLGEMYAMLISQPIFNQDRTYIPPPILERAPVKSSPPDVVLTGFIEIPGRPGKAFLKERSGGRGLTVSVGEAVDGWTATSVSAKHVVLRLDDLTAEVIRGGAPVVEAKTASADVFPNSISAIQSPVHEKSLSSKETKPAPSSSFTPQRLSQGLPDSKSVLLPMQGAPSKREPWDSLLLQAVTVTAPRSVPSTDSYSDATSQVGMPITPVIQGDADFERQPQTSSSNESKP